MSRPLRIRALARRAVVVITLALMPRMVVPAQEAARPTGARDALTYQAFDKRGGLQASVVLDLQQDRDGLLWVATSDGAAYFTGHEWVRVEMPTRVASNAVHALLFPPDGSRWFATRGGGVVRIGSSGDTTVFTVARGLPDDRVFSLAWSAAFGTPTVVAGTWSGIARLEGDRFVVVPNPADFTPTGVALAAVTAPGGAPELYVGSPNDGMIRYADGAWHEVALDAEAPVTRIEALHVVREPAADAPRLYAASPNGGVFALVGTAWTPVAGAPPGAFRVAEVRRESGARELWVGTTGGEVWRRDAGGDGWLPVRGGGIQPGDGVALIAPVARPSGEPLVYVSVRGERLTRVGLTSARRDEIPLGTGSRAVPFVRGLRLDGATELWAGTTAPGVVRLRRGGMRVDAADPALGLGAARAVSFRGDTIWVIGDSGIVRLVDGRWIRSDAGLRGAEPRRMGFGLDGELLLATDEGMMAWGGEGWRPWNGVPALQVADDLALVEDSTAEGVRRRLYVTGDRGQIWELSPDAPPRPTVRDRVGPARERVTDLLVEARPEGSRLWAATSGLGGIRLLDTWRPGATWRLVDEEVREGLPSEYVRDLARDASGRIYAATTRGVAQLRADADGTIHLETLYGVDEGLPSADVLKLATLPGGTLIVGTSQGLARLTPQVPDPARRFPLRLVARGQEGTILATGAALAHDAPGLAFDFALLNYFREEDTRYRTELVGAPGGPSAWSARHSATLPALVPGNYTFRVWARDYRGQVTGPAEFSFAVRAPWWDTPAARVAGTLAILVAAWAAFRAWQRRAEHRAAELLAREREARIQAERFQALFTRSLDGHLLLDGERIVAANPASVRLLRAPDLATLAAEDAGRVLVPPDDHGDGQEHEQVVRALDGDGIPVLAAWTTIPDASGRELRHVVLRDLSAIRAAESERNRLAEQVREAQKLDSLGTLAGGIAHDFNNLLTVIRGSAEEALETTGPDGALAVRRVLDASDRARDLVRQILTFSRRSQGEAHVAVDLAALMRDLEPLVRSSIPVTVSLVVRLPDEPVVVRGDATQLQQLLLNLVANAEHAMRGRHGTLVLELRGGSPGGGDLAWLLVRDTGRGMSPAVAARAFEPFFTTKPVGEGTGLGLAVLHGIVTAHGGTVELESVEGQGTTVTVTLPLARAAVVGRPTGASSPAPAGGGHDILLVDDDPDVLGVMTRLLRAMGHRPVPFDAPHRALEWLAGTDAPTDVLLTDQTMPGMTGDQVAEAARALRPGLPVVIVTGFSHVLTAERIAAAGVHAVLHKPVDRAELQAAITDALAGASR